MQTKQKLKYKRKLPKANLGMSIGGGILNRATPNGEPEPEESTGMDAAAKGIGIAGTALGAISSFMPQDNNDGIGITHKGSAISKGVSGGLKTAAAATQSIPILSGALGIGSALTDMVTGWVDKIREKDPTKVSRLARKGYEDSYSNVGYSFGLPQGKYGLPLFKSGGNPIYTSDPNDPRLQAYNDSLTLYKAYDFQKNNSSIPYNQWLEDIGSHYPGGGKELKKFREKNIGKPGEKISNNKKSNFIPDRPDSDYDPPYSGDKKIIEYYKSLIKNDKNYRIGQHNSPDLWHKNINPIGRYYDGAESPIYKKPVQPVIFQKEIAVPEPKVNFLNNVPLQEEMTKKDLLGIVQHPEAPSENKQPFKGNFFYQKRPNGGFNVYQNGKRVGYSPTQQSKDIRPDEDSFDFSKKNYIKGEPQFKNGGKVFAQNTVDIDSTLNANKNLNWVDRLYQKNTPTIFLPGESQPSTHYMESADNFVYPTIIQNEDGKLEYLGNKAYDHAMKTNTAIKFKTPEEAEHFAKNYKKGKNVLKGFKNGGDPQPIYTSDKNDPRLKAYNDSLSLYKKTKDIENPKYYEDGDPSWYTWKGSRREAEKFMRKNNIDLDYEYYRTGKFPGKIQPTKIGDFGEGIDYPIYKKPVQPVIYKEREQPRNIEKLESVGTTKMSTNNPEVNLNKKETSSGKYTVNTQDNSYSIPNKALFDIIVKKGMPKKSWESNGSGGATFDMSDETFFNNIGEYKKTFELGGDPRHLADIEAEKGEALQRGNKVIAIGGNTHENGGTPLKVQPNDKYIYSDTLGLDSDGKISINPKTVTQTFATLAKRTENKYKGKSDDLSLKTKDLELKMLTAKAEEARVLKEQTDEMKIMKKYKARYGADLKKFSNSGYPQFGVRPIGKTPSEEDDILTIQKRMIQNNPNALPKFGADGTWGDESKKEFANYSANAKSMVPAPVTGINNNTGLTPFSFNQKNYLDWIKSTPEYIDGTFDLKSDKAKNVFRPMYAEHIYNTHGADAYNQTVSQFQSKPGGYNIGVDKGNKTSYSYPGGNFTTNNPIQKEGIVDNNLIIPQIGGNTINSFIEPRNQRDNNRLDSLIYQPGKVNTFKGMGKIPDSRLVRPDVPGADQNTVNKNKSNLFQNLSQGDKIQLAGMIPAVAYNLGMGLRKSEVEQAKKNPYESNILNMMANRKFDMQPYLNEANLANNVAREDIGNNSTSVGGKVANLQKLYANNLNALQSLTAKEQEVNNNYRAEEANVKNTLGENARREEIRISDINAQNRATKQNFLGKAAQQIGQGINTLGRGANQSLTNQMQIKAMSELSPDYDIRPLRELYKSGQVDENGLLEFNGNKYIYDPKRDVATYVGPSTAAAAPTDQSKSPYSPIPFSLKNFTTSTNPKKRR